MHVSVLQLGDFKAASLSSVFSLPVNWSFGSLNQDSRSVIYICYLQHLDFQETQIQSNIVTSSLATANLMTPNMVPVNLRANPLNVHVFEAQYVSN